MSSLALRFFGTPRLVLDDEPVKLDRRKAEALLAYLVIEPGERRRSELALLLWPEQPRSSARAALRRTLCSLNSALGKGWLDVERSSLAVDDAASIWCDVTAFERELAGARVRGRAQPDVDALSRAVSLYDGDFLSGLTLRDASAFDEWQRTHAERLRNALADALQELVGFHTAHNDDEQAWTFAERWMMLDPLDERSHECSMRLLLSCGRRGAALRLYGAYAHRLDRELGIDPPQSMIGLRRAVRSRSAPVVEAHPRERYDGRHHAKLLRDAGAYQQVATDFKSIAAAWRWACQQRAVELIDGALDPIQAFADRNGLYHDGIELLDGAFATVDEGPVLGRLLSRQAVLYGCIGQLEKAHALLEASLRIAQNADDENEVAFCENRLGSVVFAEGSYARARQYLRSSARRYRRADNASGLSWTLNVLGHLSIGTDGAQSNLAECLDRSRRAKDEARFASALNSRGKDAYTRDDLGRARRDLSKSLALRRALEHRIGIADSLNNLGNVFVGLGQNDQARRAFEEAFDVARTIQARPLIAEILIGLASLRHSEGELPRAADLAAAALYFPGGWRDAKDRASEWLGLLSRELSPAAMESAIAAGKEFDFRAY